MNLFEKFNIETENEQLYEIAFTHSSYATLHDLDYNYERLEFLGDSVLSLIVSEYLYKKYPNYEEGQLTKNEVLSITADIFESFLGAIFIDQGMEFAKKFIADWILIYIDQDRVFFEDFKSKVKEYCDLKGLNMEYKILREYGVPHDKTFIMSCMIDGKEMGVGRGKNKKEAEQLASKHTMHKLGIWRQ